MKAAISPVTAVFVLLWVLVWPASEVWAGAYLRVLIAGGEFSWDSSAPGKNHPKKARSSGLVVDERLLNPDHLYAFCNRYVRGESNKPDKGIMDTTVKVFKSDGEEATVARLSVEVSGDFAVSCGPFIFFPLELGDVVLWEVKFKKMPSLKKSGWGQYLGGVIRPRGPFSSGSTNH
jgi:hypothetical protein